MKTRLFLLLMPLVAVSGCSSGGTASGGNSFGLTGAWVGLLRSYQNFTFDDATKTDDPATSVDEAEVTAIYSGSVVMNIVQDVDGTITGIVTVQDPESKCWTGGTLGESSISGNNIILTWEDQSGAAVTAQGTATGNTINTLFTSSEGNCEAHSGTLNMSR